MIKTSPRTMTGLPEVFKYLPEVVCFTLGEVQAMSRRGIIIFGGTIQKIMEFSTRFVRGWLNLAEDND